MAEYSFSGNTYTDKTNLVDKIDASHVNDLQDEVEIIEAAMSGGTDGQVLTADANGKANWEDAPSGGASFAFDGATFTPGDFVENSGGRDVVIELTNGGNAITSGIVAVAWVGSSLSADFSTLPMADENSQLYVDTTSLPITNTYSQGNSEYAFGVIVPAVAGHAQFTLSVGNDGAEANNVYLWLLMPSGSVTVSDAISIPGYVE